jgi:hypothetical protein
VERVTAAEFVGINERRQVDVLRWRFHELLKADYPGDEAITLASHQEVDLRLAVDLVRKGCSPATAVVILL